MFDERSVETALVEVGYLLVKRHVYRAEWSAAVEHFLYFQNYGTPKDFLAVHFGICNSGAERFARGCFEAHGPEGYRLVRDRLDPDGCAMTFSLGRLASWGVRSSLTIPDMPGRALAAKIKADIEQKLFPVIRGVTTPDRLLALLLTDAEPCPWVRCNGAMRAAMIALLARRSGARSEDIRALLQPFKAEIARNLIGASNPDALDYIERIVADSAESVRTHDS
jgi:hypothetical protein